jgi:hypothetical protein
VSLLAADLEHHPWFRITTVDTFSWANLDTIEDWWLSFIYRNSTVAKILLVSHHTHLLGDMERIIMRKFSMLFLLYQLFLNLRIILRQCFGVWRVLDISVQSCQRVFFLHRALLSFISNLKTLLNQCDEIRFGVRFFINIATTLHAAFTIS